MLSLLLLLVLQAQAGQPSSDTAADVSVYVARVHDSLLDPASFVLDNAYVTKPTKRGTVNYCIEFRAHNKLGGYTEGRAVVDGDDHKRLSLYNLDDGYGHFQGYDTGWVAPCKQRNIDRGVKAEVEALAPALYQKTR